MPVVINDFEVVPEAPPPLGPEAAPTPDGSDKVQEPTFEEAFERYQQRADRVRAH